MGNGQFLKTTIILPVCDIYETFAWYENALGLQTKYVHGSGRRGEAEDFANYAIMSRDVIEVQHSAPRSRQPPLVSRRQYARHTSCPASIGPLGQDNLTRFSDWIYKPIMNNPTQRSILRCIHILFGLPLIGFVYGPPAETEPYRYLFQYVFVPVLLLSGLWMWKGHLITRLFSKESN